MIFKHLNLYRLSNEVDIIQLSKALDSNPFEPCLPVQDRSAGFGKVFGLNKRIFSSDDTHLFCLTIQEKNVPASAVKAEYQKLVQIQDQNGKKLSRDEKAILKEQIRSGMLPRAFSKNNEIWAYIDNKNKILAINTTSRKNADGLANTVKILLGNISVHPLLPQHDVSSRMTFWLSENQSPKPFSSGLKCIIFDGDGSIHYKKRSLEDNNLRDYLQDDLKVIEMEFNYKDRVTFSLVEDFMIKDFIIHDAVLASMDSSKTKPLDKLSAEISLMSREVGQMSSDLLSALGGESSQ